MVSSAYGPGGGGYGMYPPPRPMSANDRKYTQLDQTIGGANNTFRQAMGSTSPQAIRARQQPPPQPPPAEDKGFFSKMKDKVTNIF